MEVTLYIYRETFILTILGILAGFGIGAWMHGFINTTPPPDNAMFEPGLLAFNLAVSAAMTVIISVAIRAFMHQRLKHVDMLDALKSVD